MTKRKQRSPLKGYQSGIAGEYFVAAELSRKGYVASLTLKNTAGIDILASNTKATRTIAIQVKTNQGKSPVWTLGEKAEEFESPRLFHVFVTLGKPGSTPEFYVVPSAVVARGVKRRYLEWLNTPGHHGQKRNPNPMRTYPVPKRSQNAWSRLKLDPR
ncbi:MAG: hypothetical protein Q7R41_17030 [Phycisphaerales bacterium]|nr:hypothetical protein [Phycisphaerales bacterium]